MKRFTICILILIGVGLAQYKTMAQTGVIVSGVVEDPTGAVISGAKLKLTNKATGEVHETLADAVGEFKFSNIPPGQYILAGKAEGYETADLSLTVGQEPLAAIKLRLEIELQEEVTITDSRAEQPLLPENNTSAVDLDDDLLRELPLQGQNVLPLLSNLLSAAGQGTEGVSILIDGVESGQLNIPTGSIRRLVINRNPYSAEYRRPGKARVEVVTRDGSRRRYHGEAALFVRNSIFDARDPFSLEKPDLDRRLYEVSFGGPLPINNATFFFSAARLTDDHSAVVNAYGLAGPIIENLRTPERETSLTGRFDLRPNKLHRLTFRYDFSSESEDNRGAGSFNLAESATNASERNHRLQFSDSATFSDKFLNNFRVVFGTEHQGVGSAATKPAIIVKGAFTGGPSQVFSDSRETTLEVQNVATRFHNAHTIRFGANYRPNYLRSTDATNFGGTFEFSDLSHFAAGWPYVFRISEGQPRVSFSQHEIYAFIEDDVRVRPDLSLTLGLRYGWQSNLDDNNNIAPRIAFAFAPGKRKTVLRGGAGIFYERLPERVTERAKLLDGRRIRELVITRPSYPDPFAAGDVSELPLSIVTIAPNIVAPYLMQASIAMERQLWHPRTRLTLEYLTLRGSHLLRSRNINQPLNRMRPDSNFLNINQVESSASMCSNAFTVTFDGRIGNWFKGMAQYTLSRTTDDTGGVFALPASSYDLRPEMGRADFDQRHRFSFISRVELPFEFRVSSILMLASGKPFDLTTGFDDNGDSVANDRTAGITRNTGQGPGLAQLDLRVTKLFNVWRPFNQKDRQRPGEIEINLDVFNVLNRTNFNSFVGTLSSPFFGKANSALPARTIQLSVKYIF